MLVHNFFVPEVINNTMHIMLRYNIIPVLELFFLERWISLIILYFRNNIIYNFKTWVDKGLLVEYQYLK